MKLPNLDEELPSLRPALSSLVDDEDPTKLRESVLPPVSPPPKRRRSTRMLAATASTCPTVPEFAPRRAKLRRIRKRAASKTPDQFADLASELPTQNYFPNGPSLTAAPIGEEAPRPVSALREFVSRWWIIAVASAFGIVLGLLLTKANLPVRLKLVATHSSPPPPVATATAKPEVSVARPFELSAPAPQPTAPADAEVPAASAAPVVTEPTKPSRPSAPSKAKAAAAKAKSQ